MKEKRDGLYSYANGDRPALIFFDGEHRSALFVWEYEDLYRKCEGFGIDPRPLMMYIYKALPSVHTIMIDVPVYRKNQQGG